MNFGNESSFNYEFQLFQDEEEETFLVVSIIPENLGANGQSASPKPLSTSHSSASLDSTGSQCLSQASDDSDDLGDGTLSACSRCEGEEGEQEHLWLRDPWYVIQKKGHCYCYEREENRSQLTILQAHKQEWLYNLMHFPEKLKSLSSSNKNRFNVQTLSVEMKEELKQLYVY